MFGSKKPKRIYLDWAAATPMLSEVLSAMTPYLTECFGNPSAVHSEGFEARQAIDEARTSVAKSVQVRPEYVTFTGGGTEGNNMSIIGLVESMIESGKHYSDLEVITTKIEHPSVIKTVKRLARLGVQVRYLEVDAVGKIKLDSLQSLINEKTVLVSVTYANSEIGVIQPLRQIKKVLREAENRFSTDIYFHVDGAQAPLWLTCQADAVSADLFTLDTSKCCGPKSVGVLIRSRRVKLSPMMFGGGQENGLRSGTENVAGIVGAAKALSVATSNFKTNTERVSQVRDQTILYIKKQVPEAILNGPDKNDRIANNINISLPGLDTEYATVVLDNQGFAVSTKSACSGAGGGESTVVKVISGDSDRAASTLRITLGTATKIQDLENLVDQLKNHVEKMRGI